MYRGTTPTHVFELPEIMKDLPFDALFITYQQAGRIKIEKSMHDRGVTRDGSRITVVLTQEETLSLDAGRAVQIQLRIRTTEGQALASDIIEFVPEQILKNGVI